LLRVDFHGNAQVLWKQQGDFGVLPFPSQDGRHLAILGYSASQNLWMMENY